MGYVIYEFHFKVIKGASQNISLEGLRITGSHDPWVLSSLGKVWVLYKERHAQATCHTLQAGNKGKLSCFLQMILTHSMSLSHPGRYSNLHPCVHAVWSPEWRNCLELSVGTFEIAQECCSSTRSELSMCFFKQIYSVIDFFISHSGPIIY